MAVIKNIKSSSEYKKNLKREYNKKYYERKKAQQIKKTENALTKKIKNNSAPTETHKTQTYQQEHYSCAYLADTEIQYEIKNFKNTTETENSEHSELSVPTENLKNAKKPYLKISVLLLVVAAITSFEIYESYKFYAAHDTGLPLFKAVLAVLSLTVLSTLNTEMKILKRVVMAGLMFNQIWIMSSSVVISTVSEIQVDQHLEKMISDLERQIKPKQSQLDWFKKNEWVTRARKQDDKLTPFYERLHTLKSRQLDRFEEQKVSVVMIINSWVLVMLRICLLIVGLLCSREFTVLLKM